MKKRKDFVEVVESSSQKTSRPDIFGFLKEEPKQEPIVEEVKEPVEYKFNFKETVKEERKVSRRNVFDILIEKPAEEPPALVEESQPLTISQVEVPKSVEEEPIVFHEEEKSSEYEFFPKNAYKGIKLPPPTFDLKKEAEKVKQIMEKRTPEDEESIRNHDESAAYAVRRYIAENGLEFGEDELSQVIVQCKPTIGYFKETFDVPRPHEVDKDIDAIGKMDSTTNKTRSYPSGHACQAMLVALYAAEKYPQHRDDLIEAGKESGLGRIKAGFHYVPDYTAGILLAEKLMLIINREYLGESIDVEEKFSQSDVDGLEKFADRILKKYDIDVEFTRHFVDRLNDPRNDPEIKVAELQRFFKKIQRNKGKDIRKNPDVEVVLKDLASDINLPVVINYKDGEFEVVNKTVMRKKDFKTPDKVIKYEEVVEEESVAEEEQTVISKSVEYLHNNKEEVVEKTEYDLIREELNTLKRTMATQFGKMSYGSGEVNLQFLDDVDRDTAKVDGKFLKYSASTGKWIGADATADAGGGGISWQAVKTSNFNATAGEGYFIDTSGGAVTATLPASPTLGDEVSFIDYAATADTNNITIARNGSNILAAAEDLTVSTERAGFTLVFTDSTQGWILKDK